MLRVGHRRVQVSLEVRNNFNTPDLYANPLILPILKGIFNTNFIVSDLTCVTSLPGAKSMPQHRDGEIFKGVSLAPLLPAYAVGLLIPLISFTKRPYSLLARES